MVRNVHVQSGTRPDDDGENLVFGTPKARRRAVRGGQLLGVGRPFDHLVREVRSGLAGGDPGQARLMAAGGAGAVAQDVDGDPEQPWARASTFGGDLGAQPPGLREGERDDVVGEGGIARDRGGVPVDDPGLGVEQRGLDTRPDPHRTLVEFEEEYAAALVEARDHGDLQPLARMLGP